MKLLVQIEKYLHRKKVALDGGKNLIIFCFGCHVLASIPRKFQILRLTNSTFTPSFREFVNTMAKNCAQQKDGTRRLWLRVRCRNLCSNELIPDYAFQAFFSATLRTRGKKFFLQILEIHVIQLSRLKSYDMHSHH